MGHTYGTIWTNELIEKKIRECMIGLNLNRMPSRNEMRSFYGDEALTNKVSKTLGYYGWAEKLGMGMKNSDTNIGKIGEKKMRRFFRGKWFLC